MRRVSQRQFNKMLKTDTTLDDDIYIQTTPLDRSLAFLGLLHTPDSDYLSTTFNGCGHTIYNLSKPICFSVEEEGVIKNVTIKDSAIEKASVCEVNEGVLENITVDSTVIPSENGAGLADVNNGRIESCTFTGKILREHVEANQQLGGIARSNSGMIKKCNVEQSTIKSFTDAGGIACTNTGTIAQCYCSDLTVEAQNICGGIVALNEGQVGNCELKHSEVITFDTGGGIIGNSSMISSKCVVSNSEIKVNEFVENSSSVGGIIGVLHCGSLEESRIQNSSISGDEDVGGIVGKLQQGGSVLQSKVQNEVLVRGEDYVGGVCGTIQHGNIQDILVNGDVYGTKYIGGVCGSFNSSTCRKIISSASVTNDEIECSGKLFGGVFKPSSSNVEECYYTGVDTDLNLTPEETVINSELYDAHSSTVAEIKSIVLCRES